jgi:hypothetical protein
LSFGFYGQKAMLENAAANAKAHDVYHLKEVQHGTDFYHAYTFVNDRSGMTTTSSVTKFVSLEMAVINNLTFVVQDDHDNHDNEPADQYSNNSATISTSSSTTTTQSSSPSVLYLTSQPDKIDHYGRETVLLQSHNTYHRGLFVVDVQHVPTGCGVGHSIALRSTNAPSLGTIVLTSSRNRQNTTSMTLLTQKKCDMYHHVSSSQRTGSWERVTGIADPMTGEIDSLTNVPADNCQRDASHQRPNQGCVTVNDQQVNGKEFNQQGGGVYVLEWDPINGYIQAWVFDRSKIPDDLQQSMNSATQLQQQRQQGNKDNTLVQIDPISWNVLPYAYYPMGDANNPQCPTSNFGTKLQLEFRMDFCNANVGRTFADECPHLYQQHLVRNETFSMFSCNVYVNSNPVLFQDDAYWKIRGVYIYQRGD